MNYLYEINLSQDKFKSVAPLRDLLLRIDSIKYSSYGSFLSAMHFKRSFKNTFDLLVEDETQVYDLLDDMCIIDRKKATLQFKQLADEPGSIKIKLYDTISKYGELREFILENTATETCFIAASNGDVDKLDIKIPRRGIVLMQLLIELDDDEQSKVSTIEKVVWSLSKIGVATLLRDVRFMPQPLVDIAADKIDDLMVEHANKTVSLLRLHGGDLFKGLTASELKKFGKPFAALLKA